MAKKKTEAQKSTKGISKKQTPVISEKADTEVVKTLEGLSEEPKTDNETMEDAKELANTIKELEKTKEEFEKEFNSAPDKAEDILKKEIEKVKALKNNVNRLAKKYSNVQISNSWNGMIQDW